jgi:hypothetical protein
MRLRIIPSTVRYGAVSALFVIMAAQVANATGSGNFDGDVDVDLRDFHFFQACFTGSGGSAAPTCAAGDADGDDDVDLMDYAAFHAALAGPGCPAQWSGKFDGNGINASIRDMLGFDDGSGPALYVGGFFTNAGGLHAQNVARWDGVSWSALGSGLAAGVHAIEFFDSGSGPQLYAGGVFSSGTGGPNRIAMWDGANWLPLGMGLNGNVHSLQMFDDGKGAALYVGGVFSQAGGLPAVGLARWDGTSWSMVGSGINGSVFDLMVFDDGSGPALYVAGGFTQAGGAPAKSIAKWDGATWTNPGANPGVGDLAPSSITGLGQFDDGSGNAIYAGGFFNTNGGGPFQFVARWDGAKWHGLAEGVNENVFALTSFNDGSGPALYIGGDFSSTGIAFEGIPASHIARWDGQAWSLVDTGLDNTVVAIEPFDDGTGPGLFIGGTFATAGDVQAPRIGLWQQPTAPCD